MMKRSKQLQGMDNRAVDIMIYALGGFSVVLALAMFLNALFFAF